jgi:hypothetical protein
MILFDLKKEIFVLYRADTNNGKTITIKKSAQVIINGSPMPGKDVAILKIDGEKDLPTLTFISDSLVRIGTQVLVFGYPEEATNNSFLATNAGIDPTLTSGIVSAIKKSIGGWPVIQMDAIISHGSSGSPVCNDKGEVIGLATFGSLEQGSNALASGFNFAIPFSVIKEYIDSAGIHPTLSRTSVLFNEGLGFFFQEYYHKALEKFQEAERLNNHYPQIHFYMDQCEVKIEKGNDKQAPPRKYVIWIMLTIALLTGGYLFFKQRYPRNSV